APPETGSLATLVMSSSAALGCSGSGIYKSAATLTRAITALRRLLSVEDIPSPSFPQGRSKYTKPTSTSSASALSHSPRPELPMAVRAVLDGMAKRRGQAPQVVVAPATRRRVALAGIARARRLRRMAEPVATSFRSPRLLSWAAPVDRTTTLSPVELVAAPF